MARTLEIAAVAWYRNNITELVKDGDVLAVSGITSEVVINPTEEQVQSSKQLVKLMPNKAEWALLKMQKTVTADGKLVSILAANIGTPKDVEGVNDNGAKLLDSIVQILIHGFSRLPNWRWSIRNATKLMLERYER